MRIGIFGGTFNPPHLGHKKLAEEMMSLLKLDKMLIIPANIPPHKIAKNLASGEDRLEMCHRTFADDSFEISDVELKLSGLSYTYNTLCHLTEQYKGSEFYLIIGSDMCLSFHKWFRYEDILSMVHLCIMSREDDIPPQELKDYCRNTLKLNDDEFTVSVSEPFEVSSTQIRDLLMSGEDASPYVEENTLKFINEKGLYNEVD